MVQPLTVLQLLPALGTGGVERGTLEIAEALVNAGHHAIVVAAPGHYAERLQQIGVEWYPWPIGRKSPFTLWRYIPRLLDLIACKKPHILHLRSRFPAWLGYLTWRSLPPQRRPRLVTTVHGFYSINPYSAIMTRGEAVICVSEAVYAYVRRAYPKTPPERLITIPRGIDPAFYPRGYHPPPLWYERWYQQFPQTRGKRWVVLPGRLTRWKGHEEVLALWPEIIAHHPDAHLLIVGGAARHHRAYERHLRTLIAQRHLSSSVTLTGERADLREILAASELVLSLSTRPEAFGRTTLEALALGTPVIAYHHGGVAEQLSALYPSGSVAPYDRRALGRKILAALAGTLPPVEAPLPERFTLAAMQRATLALYARLASFPSTLERTS
ncbi:MAG: glycosyltransferase family 4 protein [Hydrogenophilus sp.]|nr:glycosyltransferase family 4 protein [Hydrogenophilus sp.]